MASRHLPYLESTINSAYSLRHCHLTSAPRLDCDLLLLLVHAETSAYYQMASRHLPFLKAHSTPQMAATRLPPHNST
jgi:hypothetical protein